MDLEFRIHGILVSLICGKINGLGIAEAVHDEHHLRLFLLRLHIHQLFSLRDFRLTRRRKTFFESGELLTDDSGHRASLLQNIFVAVNIGDGLLMLLQKSIDLQSDQLPKPQLQNRICLPGGKGKLCCHHSGFSCLEADSVRNSFHKAFLCLL